MNSEKHALAQRVIQPLRQSDSNAAPTPEPTIPTSLKLFVQLFVCKAKCTSARGRYGVRRRMTESGRRAKAGGIESTGSHAMDQHRAGDKSRSHRSPNLRSKASRTFRAPAAQTPAPGLPATRRKLSS